MRRATEDIKTDMAAETQALGKGIFLAMSNANQKKGNGTRPKRMRKNGNWEEGGVELYAFYGKKGKDRSVPIKRWIDKLGQKNVITTYTDKNGKTRKRKIAGYKLTSYRPNYMKTKRVIDGETYEYIEPPAKPQDLRTRDIWRKGSKGALPFSWGGRGLADYYMRKQWRSNTGKFTAQVMISPGKFKGESDQQRVLRLLDKGGTGKGSRKLIGYRLHFIHHRTDPKGVTSIYPVRVFTDEKPTVHFKGFNLKYQVVNRINAALEKSAPTKLSDSKWRRLGAGK